MNKYVFIGLKPPSNRLIDCVLTQDSEAYLHDVVLPVVHRLRSGQNVLVHCSGGKGRILDIQGLEFTDIDT